MAKPTKLKPCPFCGGEPQMFGEKVWFWIVCDDCAGTCRGAKSKPVACTFWNKRAKGRKHD